MRAQELSARQKAALAKRFYWVAGCESKARATVARKRLLRGLGAVSAGEGCSGCGQEEPWRQRGKGHVILRDGTGTHSRKSFDAVPSQKQCEWGQPTQRRR
eukprot:TRINITY_DN964_c0_g2_i2.p2 TRINITY_DN964_c0_g2~~TRINITY_DN964_c0_g2_i2.p2  ORF type:complete len:101 (+),score=8.57 TRINITY_DN964_c0_g2_i2:132-434(+)